MAHESFEDPAIAALMNEHFVCVKVDREERPDLDDIYMAATMAMNHGHGGWPMTVFLTPEQQPFFAGTYFPPEDRHGRPGFPAILRRIAELWRDNRRRARAGRRGAHDPPARVHRAEPGCRRPRGRRSRGSSGSSPPPSTPHGAASAAHRSSRLPRCSALLLRIHRRSGDGRALQMVRRTLDGMARGGMYDQLGGGFCRYSTDDEWLVPHFEKMLYDNALLARAYLEAFQVDRRSRSTGRSPPRCSTTSCAR